MPLQKILFKPGVNRENTRYTTEGGWYECDKIRFRQGNPEKIGGWTRFSAETFLGVCRSLWNWVTLTAENLIGVGTNLKFYVSRGGFYYDITPIRAVVTLTNPFSTVSGSTTVTINQVAHGVVVNDFVTFSGASTVAGLDLNNTYQVLEVISVDAYTITASAQASSTVVYPPGGGGTVTATYEVNVGGSVQVPDIGWGAGPWGEGTWGNGVTSNIALRLWSQFNFGQNLIYGPRGGGVYYWIFDPTYTTRGIPLGQPSYALSAVSITAASPAVVTLTGFALTEGSAIQFNYTTGGSLPTGLSINTTYYVFNLSGTTFQLLNSSGAVVNTTGSASVNAYISLLVDAPIVQNAITVSDTSRFVIVLGTNDYGSTTLDPMLIRWSNQEDPFNWTPDATNQAGSVRLSHGSEIITSIQTRQEIFVLTDQAAYSLQYVGPPYIWSTQLLGDNISVMGPNAMAQASGIVFWMGVDKFYAYDGRVQTLNCDLRRFIFQDINIGQRQQVFAGTNEGFNEVWWFYCSAGSLVVDRYVIYNYIEKAWYYGTMGRTAWLDSGTLSYPIATTYDNIIVNHEDGVDDASSGTAVGIDAYISSSEFDIGDGHNFGFIWRLLPDITFSGSSYYPTAQVVMTLYGLQNSGSGVTGGEGDPVILGSNYVVTEEFTGQINTRVRGRQLIFKVESDQVGTTWQLGAPRVDIRPDGRR
jgi:hypothetical protein